MKPNLTSSAQLSLSPLNREKLPMYGGLQGYWAPILVSTSHLLEKRLLPASPVSEFLNCAIPTPPPLLFIIFTFSSDLYIWLCYTQMIKNNVTDHKLNVEAIIKNINTISLELKKMNELSQLLLCDLTLHFSHPVKTDDLKETERNSPHFEESKMPDLSLASDSF
nr:PREDICTED: putative uncharacterized protein C5orf58 homolog [Bos mutus]